MHDSAVFQCNISNRHGFQFVNAYFNVWNSPPAILFGPADDMIVAEGREALIPCRVIGAPTPKILWTKNGKSAVLDGSIRGFDRKKLMPDGSLFIPVS